MTETLEQRIQSLEKHLSAQPASPLFAQLAGYYLEAGRSQDALTVCDTGLAHYPFFTTGHLIKGRTLLALNMRSEARREFEFVHQMLPLNDAVSRLLGEIPESPDESLTAASPVEPPAEVVEAPKPPAEAPAAEESSPEQLLSQFSDEPTQSPPSESPVVSVPSPEELSSAQATEDAFGISPPSPISPEMQEPAMLPEGGQEGIPEPAASETAQQFEEFAERKREELFGLENSMSLEEYLGEAQQQLESPPEVTSPIEEQAFQETQAEPQGTEGQQEDPFAALSGPAEPESPPMTELPTETTEASEDPFAQLTQYEETSGSTPPPEGPKDQIEQIAEKLKEAKKITPVINLSEKTPTPPSESDTPSGTGFVTPTLAEIYAKQGWYDDAIKAYKTLAANKPADREKYDSRIRELEEQKRQAEQNG